MKKVTILAGLFLFAVGIFGYSETVKAFDPCDACEGVRCSHHQHVCAGNRNYSAHKCMARGMAGKKPNENYKECQDDSTFLCDPCNGAGGKGGKTCPKGKACYVRKGGSVNGTCKTPKKRKGWIQCGDANQSDPCDGCKNKKCKVGYACYWHDGYTPFCYRADEATSSWEKCTKTVKRCDLCKNVKCQQGSSCFVTKVAPVKGECYFDTFKDSHYKKCSSSSGGGGNISALKKAYKDAKKIKSEAWKKYKKVKSSEKKKYQNTRKDAWKKYKTKKSDSYDKFKNKKAGAKSKYYGQKKSLRHEYDEAKKGPKNTYEDAKKAYEKARKAYKKCRDDGGSSKDCKDKRDKYRQLRDKKNSALENYKEIRSDAKSKYEKERNGAKDYYKKTVDELRKDYSNSKKELRADYDKTKSDAKTKYTSVVKDVRGVYDGAKEIYLKAKKAYQDSKK